MPASSVTYQCTPSTRWVVELDRIVVVNQMTGTVRSLEYPRAALWDFIARGYSYDQIIPMLCSIASLQRDAIEELVGQSLEQWTQAGFLKRIDRHG